LGSLRQYSYRFCCAAWRRQQRRIGDALFYGGDALLARACENGAAWRVSPVRSFLERYQDIADIGS
jgi:hypothetical protein